MKKTIYFKTFLFVSMCFYILAGAENAFSDSIRVDVSPTHVSGFTRYCFQITNDDQNEPDPKHHIKNIASLIIKYVCKDTTKADHRFRGNITGPDNWNGNISITDEGQKVTWKTENEKETIMPGDRSDVFCFVVNGEITMTEYETKFLLSSDSYTSQSKGPYPFGEVFLTDENDIDFLRDTDGNGIPDKFDEDPDGVN